MSISVFPEDTYADQDTQQARSPRIRREILSLFSDPRLKGTISIPVFDLNSIKVYLLIHKEVLLIRFPKSFPKERPQVKLDNHSISFFFGHSESLQNWTCNSKLSDVVYEICHNLQNYSESKYMPARSILDKPEEDRAKEHKDSSDENNNKKKVMMNGCADNELTETKNLNRHFRSKLREVYSDLLKAEVPVPDDARWIEASFTMPRVGFEDIARVLKNQWFNQEVYQQMENGKFLHKIMKGMMSIKSKKLMVKYYHVMLAAVKNPDNFVKWKYQ